MRIGLRDVVKMQWIGLLGVGFWMWLSGCMKIGLKDAVKMQWIGLPRMDILMWLNGCVRMAMVFDYFLCLKVFISRKI